MKRIVTLSVATILASALFSVGGGSTAPQRASAASSYPLRVVSGDGNILITSRPIRILSLSASATQMLYAIGAGSQVIGVDKYSLYPTNAPRTKFSGYETSAEGYLRLKPDLVVLAFDTSHVVEQLKKLHIATLLLPPASTVAQVNGQIRELGIATGHSLTASQEVASIAANLNSVSAHVGTIAKGKTYFVELDPTLYSATSKTFIGALFNRFGMVNIADKAARASSGYPQLNSEYLITANPQFVFLADTSCCKQSPATFDSRAGYSTISAVKNHHVIAVDESLVSEWGPHSLEEFIKIIARVITAATTTS